ncbi:CoA transferase [Thermoleophilia bacterium SCSIO 60948]|nr:CoA transferase [Thermoleophilia bacterium SCSIO 60948]
MSSPRPALDGLRVVDLSRVLAGPLAAMTLGDLGADVIKVESPEGDETRAWAPPENAAGGSTYFDAANRNKRSIALDLRRPEDLELARELIARADVVIENFRAGTMARLGLDPAELRRRDPRLVVCSITGFGSGAGAALAGYDPLVQALSGLMSVTGEAAGPALKVGVALVDVVAGMNAAGAILAALLARERDGGGQLIEVNLLQTALAALANQSSAHLGAGVVPSRAGNSHPSIVPFETYATRDRELMICAGNERQFAALCDLIGEPSLAADPRFATNRDRVANREAMRELLEGALAARDAADWTRLAAERGVPAGPVNDIAEAFELAARLELDPVATLAGSRTPSSPLGLLGTPPSVRLPPPSLDEHGDAIRERLRSGGA